MASLSFAEKTRIGAFLRRVMLDGTDPSEVQLVRNTEHSAYANQGPGAWWCGPLPRFRA